MTTPNRITLEYDLEYLKALVAKDQGVSVTAIELKFGIQTHGQFDQPCTPYVDKVTVINNRPKPINVADR